MSVKYPTVCSYLVSENLDNQMDFLIKVFGASLITQLRLATGQLQHAEVKIGDSVIMMGRLSEGAPPRPSTNYVFVTNVFETFELALRNGGRELTMPSQNRYGIRECGVVDQYANIWWIGQWVD